MYKLSPSPKYVYNKDFVSNFQRKECFESDQTYPDLIKDWWRNEEKFRADTHGIYATASLNEYMIYVAMMLCRLFSKKSPTHFPAEWVPLLHEAAEGYNFNWDKILSDNMVKEVMDYQTARSKGRTNSLLYVGIHHGCYMLLDSFPFDELELESDLPRANSRISF
jgi:hypothetical protein